MIHTNINASFADNLSVSFSYSPGDAATRYEPAMEPELEVVAVVRNGESVLEYLEDAEYEEVRDALWKIVGQRKERE